MTKNDPKKDQKFQKNLTKKFYKKQGIPCNEMTHILKNLKVMYLMLTSVPAQLMPKWL